MVASPLGITGHSTRTLKQHILSSSTNSETSERSIHAPRHDESPTTSISRPASQRSSSCRDTSVNRHRLLNPTLFRNNIASTNCRPSPRPAPMQPFVTLWPSAYATLPFFHRRPVSQYDLRPRTAPPSCNWSLPSRTFHEPSSIPSDYFSATRLGKIQDNDKHDDVVDLWPTSYNPNPSTSSSASRNLFATIKALDEGRSSGRAPLPSLFTVHHYAAIPQSTLFPAASPFAVPTIGTSATCYLRRATEDGFGATPSVPAVLVADPPPTPSYHTHSSYARQR